MAILRSPWIRVAIGVLGFMVGAIAPACAGGSVSCDWAKANALRSLADRHRTAGQFVSAAAQYIAASRSVSDCLTDNGLMLSARSLAQGGAALAQSGDYLNARSVLQSAQSRLESMFSIDPQTATAARSYFDLVQTMISAIDRIAQSSM